MGRGSVSPTITSRRSVLLAAAGAGVLALVLLIPVAASINLTCTACHAPAKQSGPKGVSSSHKEVSCRACHAGSGVTGSYRLGLSVIGEMGPAQFRVARYARGVVPADEACLGCHAAVLDDGRVDARGFVINHATCATAGTCVSCHGSAGHSGTPASMRSYLMEDCVTCHRTEGAGTRCDTCHSARSERARLTKGPWQVTHGKNWQETHGMGSLEHCGTCHPDDYCTDCHGVQLPHPAKWGSSHGASAIKTRASCSRCHDKSLCSTCHGIEMPHPRGFLKRHSRVTQDHKDPACTKRCHAVDDCSNCHVLHVHPGTGAFGRSGGDGDAR